MTTRRALHWVFKIGNRSSSVQFFKDTLKMKALRHEEFKEGCDAACNGPYDGRWSKTMIGYGSEDNHFVMELTYNYGIDKYELGDDFIGIHINSPEIYKSIEGDDEFGSKKIVSPDGYPFYISNTPNDTDPVQGISLVSTNLSETIKFWNGILGLQIAEQKENEVTLKFGDGQAFVRFVLKHSINHAKAYGRVAFSLPLEELKPLEESATKAGYKILTRFITLSTPGKEDVSVVIFGDPDGHEICFVGDEGFRVLSQIDPEADALLVKNISEDTSNEWFAKKGRSKAQA